MAKLACLIQEENSQEEVLILRTAGLIYNRKKRGGKGMKKELQKGNRIG